MKSLFRASLLACALGISALPSHARDVVEIPLELGFGAAAERIEGEIAGHERIDYTFEAHRGDVLSVTLDSPHPEIRFSILRHDGPGFIAIAGPDDRHVEMALAEGGTYRVNVHFLPEAARADRRGAYVLRISRSAHFPSQPDYADGMSGGPDWWQVTGLSAGGLLNLRDAPGPGAAILTRLPAGAPLRNQGCRMHDGQRWCRVETTGQPRFIGWVSGAYLSEGGEP